MHDLDVFKLDGRLLKVFLTVYDQGSVSQAAETMDLNQSTVSHGIERLRKSLGDPLFVKSGRGIIPTEFAVTIAPIVREVLSLLDGITQSAAYTPDKDERPITIAANISELMPEVAKIRSRVASEAPELPVRFLELGSRENIEAFLESGKADIVITARPASYPRTVRAIEYIADDNVCFYDAAVRNRIETIEDYSRARHAALDFGGNRLSNVSQELEKNAISRKVFLTAPNSFALGRLIVGTDLVATMQRRLRLSVFQGLEWCEAPFKLPSVHFDMAWHVRSDASARNLWIREIAMAAKS